MVRTVHWKNAREDAFWFSYFSLDALNDDDIDYEFMSRSRTADIHFFLFVSLDTKNEVVF